MTCSGITRQIRNFLQTKLLEFFVSSSSVLEDRSHLLELLSAVMPREQESSLAPAEKLARLSTLNHVDQTGWLAKETSAIGCGSCAHQVEATGAKSTFQPTRPIYVGLHVSPLRQALFVIIKSGGRKRFFFGNWGFCPFLSRNGGFDENGDNDECPFCPQQQGVCS